MSLLTVIAKKQYSSIAITIITLIIIIKLQQQQQLTMHRQCQLKLRPQHQIPNIKLQQLCEYPQLQRRVNSQQYELSGIHNLIVQLKKQTIQELKQQFISNSNTVNLHQFMWLISNSVMRTSMRVGPKRANLDRNQNRYQSGLGNESGVGVGVGMGSAVNVGSNANIVNQRALSSDLQDEYYRYEIQYQIVKVFEQIDIDNSNSISWEEYIEYITSSSLMEISQNEGDLAALAMDDKKVKEVGFSHKEKAMFRKNAIRKIVQVERMDMLAIVEKKSDLLTFIGINGNQLAKPFELNGIDHNKVLSIDYSEDERIFGVLLSSHMVMFVEDGEIPKVNVDNRFTGDQVQIIYLRQHKLWLLSSLDFTIQIFTPDKGRKKQEDKDRTIIRFKPHAQQPIAIKQLHNPLSILTASYKNSIKIWSLTLNQLLIELNPGNQDDFLQCKSIKGVEVYNNCSTTYMVCWMFSPQISVWLPSSSLTKPYLGKLKGHVGIVQQAKFLTNFPTVVSIDNKRSVRVWDLTKMQCVQAWKIQSTHNIRIDVLQSLPYVLFYDKLIEFYKSNKESNLIEYNSQKKSALSVAAQLTIDQKKTSSNSNKKPKLQRKGSSSIPQSSKLIESNQQLIKQVPKQRQSLLKSRREANKSFEDSFENQSNQKLSKVIVVLYDDYLDCFAILTAQSLTLIAANTGKIIHKIYPDKIGESYVAMCLKENRRIFLTNNLGEIQCIKSQDCSILYKICPYFERSVNQKVSSIKAPSKQPSSKTGANNLNKQLQSQYFTFTINYNPYNQVLTIIAECEFNSILITYDNFSSFEPQKKKQIVFDQLGLISFASAAKYNLFYLASNRPEAVTIWDYHNFTMIRSLQMSSPIISMSVQNTRLNMLIIVEQYGVRLLKIAPIDAKNNARSSQTATVTQELYIKHGKKLEKAELVLIKSQGAKKQKKTKVTFYDDQNKAQKETAQISKSGKILNLFLISQSSLEIVDLQNCSLTTTEVAQPMHCDKANITKQLKKISINSQSQSFPPPKQTLSILSGAKLNHINGFKKNMIILGKVNDLIYFENDEGVLCFYHIELGKSQAKLSLPKCQIIEWSLCYNLVNKIIFRLKKAEQISKQIYAHKRKLKSDDKKNQYLRMCFLLNKYFNEDDMKDIRNYFAATQKSRKHIKLVDKPSDIATVAMQNGRSKEPSYFEQKYEERSYNPNQKAAKLKQIQKKYSKAFSYIRKRQQSSAHTENISNKDKLTTPTGFTEKTRSASAHKLKQKSTIVQTKMKNSTSLFKIRNTVSSANKMYFEHTKEIKICLAKIGIINSKIKDMKL